MNTITTPKAAAQSKNVVEFIAWDKEYQKKRANNGRAQGRNAYSVEDILADMVRVSNNEGVELERMTGKQYQNAKGAFSRPGVEKRFGTWTKAREYAVQAIELGLIERNGKSSGMSILKDMRQVAINLNINVLELSSTVYEKNGNYGRTTVRRYYGSWKNAKDEAFDNFVNHDWDDVR